MSKLYELISSQDKLTLFHIASYVAAISERYQNKYITNNSRAQLPERFQIELKARENLLLIHSLQKEGTKKIKMSSTGNGLVDVLLQKHYIRACKLNYFNTTYDPERKIAISYYSTRSLLTKLEILIIRLKDLIHLIRCRKTSTIEDLNNRINLVAFMHTSTGSPYYELMMRQYKKAKLTCKAIDYDDVVRSQKHCNTKAMSHVMRLAGPLIKLMLNKPRYFLEHSSFVIQSICDSIYLQKVYNLFVSTRPKAVVCTKLSYGYQNIVFQACEHLKIRSIMYDFSLGYPYRRQDIKYMRYALDTKRSPSELYVLSKSRMSQYKLNKEASKIKKIAYCHNPLYSSIRGQQLSHNANNKKLQLHIFDNLCGHEALVTPRIVDELIEALSPYRSYITIVFNEKKRNSYLSKLLYKSGFAFEIAAQACYEKSIKSDILISLGFQGSAILTSYYLKKPLIFFDVEPWKDCLINNENGCNFSYYFKLLTSNREDLSEIIIKLIGSDKEKITASLYEASRKFHQNFGLNDDIIFSWEKLITDIN